MEVVDGRNMKDGGDGDVSKGGLGFICDPARRVTVVYDLVVSKKKAVVKVMNNTRLVRFLFYIDTKPDNDGLGWVCFTKRP